MSKGYLPICKEDMIKRGWDQVDFVYVSGDAYVDHPSFGHAIITRILNHTDIRWGSLRSRTGKRKKVLWNTGSRD